jgi:putative DNA primase/helicase
MHLPLGDFDEHTKPPMTEAKEDLIELGMKPAERFMKEWIEGFLDLPLQVCSAEQLYRAFRRWCDRGGERWWPAQGAFTNDAKRWAIEREERDKATGNRLAPCLVYKVVTGVDHKLAGKRTSMRCWMPRGTGCPDGQSEGNWAIESASAFENSLMRFLGRAEEVAAGAAPIHRPYPTPRPPLLERKESEMALFRRRRNGITPRTRVVTCVTPLRHCASSRTGVRGCGCLCVRGSPGVTA